MTRHGPSEPLPGRRRRRLAPSVAAEAGIVVALVVVVAVVTGHREPLAAVVRWDLSHPGSPLGEVVFLLAVSHLFMLAFGARRGRQLAREHRGRTAAEEDLTHRARHDQLTGLVARSALVEDVAAACDLALVDEHPVSVVSLDLVDFRSVNQAFGHATGDGLLVVVAGRLAAALDATRPAGATLARTGPDEFLVLLPGADDAEALVVARALRSAVRGTVEAGCVVLDVDVAVAVATTPPGGSSGIDLLRRLDAALRDPTGAGVRVAGSGSELAAAGERRLLLLGQLRVGIEAGELVNHYQPQVDCRTGDVVGLEALVRWRHPERGLLAPSEFLDLAEQTALIRPLTRTVLDRALADCAHWRAGGLDARVAVNLSARALDPHLGELIADLLRAHGLEPSAVELEITETSALVDPATTLALLQDLRAEGHPVSVDDYGTGHASLSYLTQLPVTALKIDRSFVTGVEHGGAGAAIVWSTIALAHRLGLEVVAEGVETAAAHEALVRAGCDATQGYWLGPPVPAEEVPAAVERVRRLLLDPVPGPVRPRG